MNTAKTDIRPLIPTSILLLAALALAGQAVAQPLIEPHVLGPSVRFTRHSIRAGEAVEGRIFGSAYWGAAGAQHPAYVEEQWVSLDQHEIPLTTCHPWTDANSQPVIVHGHGDWSGSDPTPWADFAFPSSSTAYRMLRRLRLCSSCKGNVCSGNATDFDTLQITQPDSPPHDPVQSPLTDPSRTVTTPKPGSYTILANYEGNEFVGYTRFEVEAEPCDTAPDYLGEGISWRISKTYYGGYFNPYMPDQFRFCASPRTTSPGGYGGPLTYLGATHGTIFTGRHYPEATFADYLANVQVEYDDTAAGSHKSAASLGGFPTSAPLCAELEGDPINCLSPFDFNQGVNYTRDASHHDVFGDEATNAAFYALLPGAWDGSGDPIEYTYPANLPASITEPGIVVVEQEMSPRPGNTGVDETGPEMSVREVGIWHLETLAPNEAPNGLPGGSEALRTRYMEYGKFKITEDWVWRDNGLVTRISLWDPTVKRCWRTNTGSDDLVDPGTYEARCLPDAFPSIPGNQPKIDARVVETFLADGDPLELALTGHEGVGAPCEGSGPPVDPWSCWQLDDATQTYTLEVAQPGNGNQGYSGFLEVQVYLGFGYTQQSLWTSANGFPIYVHQGRVNVPPAAYGGASGSYIVRVRSFFTTRDLDAFGTAPSSPVNGNAGGAWSNWFQLVIP